MGSLIRLRDHADHAWEKRRQCVYCIPCNLRLYAGSLPRGGKKAELVEALDGALEALRDHASKKKGRKKR